MEPGKVSMKSVKAGAKESIRELGNATAVAVVQAGKYQLQKAVGVDVDDVVEGDRAVIDETVEAVRDASVFAKEGGMQVEDIEGESKVEAAEVGKVGEGDGGRLLRSQKIDLGALIEDDEIETRGEDATEFKVSALVGAGGGKRSKFTGSWKAAMIYSAPEEFEHRSARTKEYGRI